MRGIQRWGLAAAAIATGCWGGPGPAPPPEPVELVRAPPGVVEPSEAVTISWSAALVLLDSPTLTSRGDPVAASVELGPGRVELRPRPTWPEGQLVEVDFADGLVDTAGAVQVPPTVRFLVAGASERPSAPLALRHPAPGRPAPPNLAWLVASGPAPAGEIWLASGSGHRVRATSPGTTLGPRVFALDRAGACAGLCPGERYVLDGADPGAGFEVITGTVADERAPALEALAVRGGALSIAVELRSSEVVRAEGRWFAAGEGGALVADGPPDRLVRLRADPAPTTPGEVGIEVVVYDLADARTATAARAAVSDLPRVRITELVPTARRDWGDSEPNGAPFDRWPGAGTVSSADEWVELVNWGDAPVDVGAAELEVRALDGSPALTQVASAPALYFGDGGRLDAWGPGEALVVRLRGDMAQRGLTLEVWAGPTLLDRVVLDRAADADHPGGPPPDLWHESLARTADGVLRWCVPTPGDPTPNPVCHGD